MQEKVVILVVIVVLGGTSATPQNGNQRPSLHNGRIIGGVVADRHEFKFVVNIHRPSYYFAGTIISPEWVVTSAQFAWDDLSTYTIVAGDHKIDTVDGEEQFRNVTKILIHPNYTSLDTTRFILYENDVALMRVTPPFELNEFVQPAVFPEAGFVPPPVCTVAGWGATTESGTAYSTDLLKVNVPFVDHDTCHASFDSIGRGIAESMICYGEPRRDSCSGDQGAPLVCGENQTLCGISSWGNRCGLPGFPGVYTEISYFLEWIRSSISSVEEDLTPVETVTSCGGRIDVTSASINYLVEGSIRANQRCVWIVKVPYDTIRFRLQSSGLSGSDGLYVTKFVNSVPREQQRVSSVGQNYTLSGGGVVIITLAVGSAPTRGFSLHLFSSGLADQTPDFTGFMQTSGETGNLTYPSHGGGYDNFENALFIIAPATPQQRFISFLAMDLENWSGCTADAVSVYSWLNGMYALITRTCGTTIPPTLTLHESLGLVTFTSDVHITRSGFAFEWM
ncbi:ovochymase-2 isoform X2 [Folsomia candida]|uniref:ovochymase-2 isoform X2 n=1 Tax=Folsomia candida TaxID=158441 RepID=UPI000B8F2D4C|nr:ovochymase-2 isoform X2 [Folsomia candida]